MEKSNQESVKKTNRQSTNNNLKVLMKYRYRNEWREKYVTLSDVTNWTREGKYKTRVEAVRGGEVVPTEIGMASGAVAADYLPHVFPAKGAPNGGISKKGVTMPNYTGLVLLSLRMTQGMDVLEQLRRQVNVWPQTLLSFVGADGQSLKVLIPYEMTGGGVPEDARQVALFQKYAYKRAAEYVLNSTGFRAEESLHDGNEFFFVSSDERAYYNPDALPIRMEQPTEELSDMTAPPVNGSAEVKLDTEVLPGYTRREMDITNFNFICRNLSFKQLQEPESHLMRLATDCRKAGIDQELAIQLTADMIDFRDKDTLVRSTFNNAYSKHRLGLKKPVERTMMHQQLLEEFLKRRYMFRRNSVTGEVEFQEKYQYKLWWKPLTEAARNDINNAAIREGIKVWPQDLERILISEHTEQYDPVREWLSALPKWDGRDRLGELASRLKTQTPGWTENFRVWMRSMVSQWRAGTDTMYGAQMVLMLVGAQGTRKSTFMRMLLPPELSPFYIDRIDFTNRKEALQALHRFLLINIDEYDQISKSQSAFLKHLIQRTDVKERKLYSTVFEQQQRYAVFCATTNSLMPLKDESGSRRYMVVEVSDKIDTDTQGDKAIDYPQLYAQICHEIEQGEEYAFTGERERQVIEQNVDYYEMPNVIGLFEDLFHRPQAGDEVKMMSPTEILTFIKDEKHVNVVTQSNATFLGGYLHRNGFEKGEGRQRRRYEVALTT